MFRTVANLKSLGDIFLTGDAGSTRYTLKEKILDEVDKECVSEVCKVLLSELDIANKKIEKTKDALTKLIEKIDYDYCVCLREHHIEEYINYFFEELESSDKE